MRKEFDVDLRFRLAVDVGDVEPIATDELWSQLRQIFDSWSDGRRPFHVEMVLRGVEEAAADAVQGAIYARARRLHGSEMVTSADGRSQTSRAHLAAQAAGRYASVHASWGDTSMVVVSEVRSENLKPFLEARTAADRAAKKARR